MNPAVLSESAVFPITFLASILIWLMFAGLFVLWLIDGRIKREAVLHALFSSLVAWVFAQMIKSLLPTQRPFELNGFSPMTLTLPIDGAFPSAHTAVAFALATSVWLHNKKIGLIFLITAALIGLGRFLGNVHYFVDIVGGAVIGIVVVYIFEKLHLFKLIK